MNHKNYLLSGVLVFFLFLINTTSIFANQQIVILKADDLEFNQNIEVHMNMKQFFDFVIRNEVKPAVGLIGQSLEGGVFNDNSKKIKKWHNEGLIEIFNHGYNHLCDVTQEQFIISQKESYKQIDNFSGRGEYWEFYNTGFEYQREHILKTQKLAIDKLGIKMVTFGCPCNKYDDDMLLVLDEILDIRNIFFVEDTKENKFYFNNRIDLEKRPGLADFQFFMDNYQEQLPYMVVQVHPVMWDERSWEEFRKFIFFLKEHGSVFMTPSQAAAALKGE